MRPVCTTTQKEQRSLLLLIKKMIALISLVSILTGCLFDYLEQGKSTLSSPRSSAEDTREIRTIPISFSLDLLVRQAIVTSSGKRSQAEAQGSRTALTLAVPRLKLIVNDLNKYFSDTRFRFRLGLIQSWESTEEGSEIALSRLKESLLKTWESSPISMRGLIVGIVGSSPPSFSQMDDLRRTQLGSPAIIIRELSTFYDGSLKQGDQALGRLLARSIAEVFGAAPTCERGWSSASRDELLGLLHSSHYGSTTFQKTQRITKTQTLPASTVMSSIEERWRFTDLEWGPLSKRIFLNFAKLEEGSALTLQRSVHHSCEDWRSFQSFCPQSSQLQRVLAEGCFQDEAELITAYNDKRLEDPQWADERVIVEGILALNEGKFRRAWESCSSIAQHNPASNASRCAGLAAHHLNLDEEASIFLRAHLSHHPLDFEAQAALAKSLGRLDRDEEAVGLLRRLSAYPETQLGPIRSNIYFNLGVAEARIGNWSAAIKAWQALSSTDQEFDEAQRLIKAAPR